MIIFLGVRLAALMFGFAWPLGCLAARRCAAVASAVELIIEIAWATFVVFRAVIGEEGVRK